jgi:flagellar basal-body rod protein FlgB
VGGTEEGQLIDASRRSASSLMNLINDVTHQTLAVGLHGSSLRSQALAQNIANINTPGYQRSDVSFQDQLAAAVQEAKFDPATGGLVNSDPQIAKDKSAPVRDDGGTVDVDQENAEVAQNALYYQGISSLIGTRRRMLETAMRTSGV